ncbi:MAG: OmpA family protein [Motiliproteus sp.]
MKSNAQQSSRITFLVQKLRPTLCASLLVVLSGCVSSGKYDSLVTERDSLLEEQALLNSRVAETEQQQKAAATKAAEAQAEITRQKEAATQTAAEALAAIARQKEAAAKTAAEAQAEIDRQQQVYSNLQATFAQEQQASQVKIEMMKSGVKVNLANEILFPSGSATLNDSGVEVLTRAAAELKKSPYQAVVAGFTDDISISGKLSHKYPSNWELAGARAASVVRLLEQEGVPPTQLLAVSFGQNSPVESNDTSEGRDKNRRIEIILRPVPVTMN